MKRYLSAFVFAATLLASMPAWALDLHAARSAGLIGEKSDGYVEALQPSADVSALADDVNAKRKAEYARISQANGQPVDVVAKLAAGEIVKKLEAGSQYQSADGAWHKK